MAEGSEEMRRQRSVERALRNLVVAGVLLVVGATVLLARQLGPRETVLVVAAATALLLVLAVAARPLRTVGSWAWAAVLGAFVLSRSTTFLAGGRVYAVRDAVVHIVGIPSILVDTGHLPGTGYDADIDAYRFYPALHLVQAFFHLVGGLPLWDASALVAMAIGLATLGLIGLATRNVFPQAGVLAGAAFVVAPLASAQHQALQPLSLALLCLAGFAYLLSRPPSHLEETMFAATGLLLALSHPYSTVVIGLGLLVTILTLALWLRQFRFLAPVGVGAAGAITYLAVIAQDFDRFLQFLSPPSSTGVLPPSESVDPGGARNSATWAFVEAWKFRLPVLLGLVGWALAWKKPRPALALQVLLAAFGGIYLVALAVPGSIPNRVLAITAVPLAPFLGYALLRMTPAGAIPAILACALLAGTGVHAALQFTPWARDGQALPQPLDDPAGMDSVTDYFLGLEGGRLAVTNPISSHYIFKGNTSVDVRGFSGVDEPGRAPREYYFYREVAEDSGFAMTRPGRGRTTEFHFYPTAGNLELVASMDRIADVGEIQVHRH